MTRLLLALAGAVVAALSVAGASPPVTVALRSSFSASDPLLEAFESVAMEDPSVLFPLLSAFSLTDNPSAPLHAHSAVFAAASDHMHSAALNSARVRLALHAAMPRLVASAEYYDRHISNLTNNHMLQSPECASWVDWYGQIVCDAQTLLRVASSQGDCVVAKPKRLPFDHTRQASLSLEEPPCTAIHFADPAAPSFRSLHEALLSLEPNVEYLLRWARGTVEREEDRFSSYLSGYGVYLDLKKMDYLATDDRNQHLGHAAAQKSTEPTQSGPREFLEEVLACIFNSLPYIDKEAETKALKGEPLTSEEIADLGLKTIEFVIAFSNKSLVELPHINQCYDKHRVSTPSDVQLFQTLTNSFPLYATSLARKIVVSEEVKHEVYDNWRKAAQGVNVAWVNGRALSEKEGSTADIFGLLRTLQRERALVKSLVDLGLTTDQAIELLLNPVLSTSQRSGSLASKKASVRDHAKNAEDFEGVVEEKKTFSLPQKIAEYLEGLVDASDRREGGSVVLYWNDLATDTRYAKSSPSLQGLLRVHAMSLFSPVLRIRQNLINVIFVLDLSQARSLSLLGSLSEHFVARGFPVRWGFVPECEGNGLIMARLVYHINHMYGRDRMIAFIQEISRALAERRLPSLTWEIIHDTFRSFGDEDDLTKVALGNIPENSMIGEVITQSRKYSRRLGLGVRSTSGKGHAFINGRHLPITESVFQLMSSEITAQLQILQEMARVYAGDITDDDINLMPTFFYDLPSTLSRRNSLIFVDSPSGHGHALDGSTLKMFNLHEVFSKASFQAKEGSFVVPSQIDDIIMSVYVIADFDSKEGLELAKESLKFMTHSFRARVTFIHNSEVKTNGPTSTLISTLFLTSSLSDVPPSELLEALTSGSDEPRVRATQQSLNPTREVVTPVDMQCLLQASRMVTRQLGLQSGQRAILVNGRLVGPFDASSEFVAEDFEMLEGFEIKHRVGRVADAINDITGGDNTVDPIGLKRADLISMASSIINADQQPEPSEAGLFDSATKPRTGNYRLLSSSYTKLAVGDPSSAQSHVAVLVDPLSETAQRWSAMLAWWSEIFPGIYIELYFNPSQHTEIPLKRFYRYNAVPRLDYDTNGQEIPAKIMFNGLPLEPIYTLGMDVPPSWLVRPREALYDLDNIQLGKLSLEDQSQGIQVLFVLDYFVVEGHARELKTVNPPRGVQLQLINTKDGSIVDDTQVVANLGYLQFKVRPGTFRLEIREGRGREIYEIESVGSEGWNSPSVTTAGDELTVMSFDGLTLYPRLARKPGTERQDVLDGLQDASEPVSMMENWLSKISSLLRPGTNDKRTRSIQKRDDGHQADINIFTVASGLLYERFASIMILSVLRNTKKSVKFWFIENFLSPSFLEFIPHMAEEYGFQYELVTYKWPSWLRPQKEKQRVIWAYKILFLDVLFPMNLKKVIFVDADQIVRADLQDLVDLDLHGAPYGYTPMGDDSYDMEGFRFWKTGYWHDFLDGKPYHISALYVVDLVRFRQMAAGDLLRGSYQLLSQDPNSLANLDQDLPNSLQAQVPIFSLHEDWLWCETWCSKDRLHRAKTIDLCQNPLTKEPKLSRARQIPEWEEYDNEIAEFTRRLAAEGKIRASVATADSNVLAGSIVTQPRTDSPGSSVANEPSSSLHEEL